MKGLDPFWRWWPISSCGCVICIHVSETITLNLFNQITSNMAWRLPTIGLNPFQDSDICFTFRYLPTFGRLNPESSRTWWRMTFRKVWSPVSMYFSLSLTDRHHWQWYTPWLPTNHLSTVTTCPEWETWHPFGENPDLFCKIGDSVTFWGERGMRNTWCKCIKIPQNAERLAGMHVN